MVIITSYKLIIILSGHNPQCPVSMPSCIVPYVICYLHLLFDSLKFETNLRFTLSLIQKKNPSHLFITLRLGFIILVNIIWILIQVIYCKVIL
jgi:1-acyl-sn-glycerol-3-phosphate acyltransferase